MADTQTLGASQGDSLPAESKRDLGVWEQLLSGTNLRQLGLVVGLALALAMALGLFFWAQTPNYRTVYSGLPEEERARVVEALQASDIEYRIDRDSGAIRVPANQVHETRLYLASQGLPQGQGVGYELLQQDQGFGTSQFMENARFQRALETELARSIMSLGAVDSARVHLAVPRETVFIRETSQPSASVVLSLHGGRVLGEQQVAAIVHLVSSSVPNLQEDRVSVVDQRGNLLTRDSSHDSLGLSGRQFAYQQRVEEAYARRVEQLLAPIVGSGRVRAQVSTDIDFSHQERTEELFDPDATVVRSEQTLEERRERNDQAMGVPGALTNQPPGEGVIGDDPGLPDEEALQPFSVTNSATRNFEVGKTVRHIREAQGGITRLTVAVVVDQPQVAGENGQMERQPLPQDELDRLTGLVQDAVGFNAGRGDNVSVVSAPFLSLDEQEPLQEDPLWQHPVVADLGRWMIAGLLGLALIMMVIRPLVKALIAGPVGQGTRVDTRDPALEDQSSTDEPRRLGGQDAAPARIGQYGPDTESTQAHNDRLDVARELAEKEPALAANLIKNWLSENER